MTRHRGQLATLRVSGQLCAPARTVSRRRGAGRRGRAGCLVDQSSAPNAYDVMAGSSFQATRSRPDEGLGGRARIVGPSDRSHHADPAGAGADHLVQLRLVDAADREPRLGAQVSRWSDPRRVRDQRRGRPARSPAWSASHTPVPRRSSPCARPRSPCPPPAPRGWTGRRVPTRAAASSPCGRTRRSVRGAPCRHRTAPRVGGESFTQTIARGKRWATVRAVSKRGQLGFGIEVLLTDLHDVDAAEERLGQEVGEVALLRARVGAQVQPGELEAGRESHQGGHARQRNGSPP